MQDQHTAMASATLTPSPTGLPTGGCVAEDVAAELEAIVAKGWLLNNCGGVGGFGRVAA